MQALFFVLFVYLFFAGVQSRAALALSDLFFRLDVLAGVSAMLSVRAWIPRLGLGLVVFASTLLVGRVWCGWVCPMGTVLEWLSFGRGKARASAPSPRWRWIKYGLLLLTLAASVWSSLAMLVLDPLALLARVSTTAVLPVLNQVVTTLERSAYRLPLLRPVVDGVERALRGTVLPTVQPVFFQNVAIVLLFSTILALNWWSDRFWCRFLCPLGAVLGLLSKVSLLRPTLGDSCNRCGRCADVCRLGAIEAERGYAIAASECTLCLDCLGACPEQGAGLSWHRQPDPAREYEPTPHRRGATRRRVLAALVVAAAAVATLRTSVRSRSRHPLLIRPPGAQDEGAFLSRCLRCSQCMRVCPTSGLQPALSEAGVEGLWTPRLVPRLGYCDFGCNACGQACPSQAIPALGLERKREAIIGLASVDRNRCLPWAYGVPCIVCEEMCPVPDKAIKLEVITVTDAQGKEMALQRPVVRRDLCIGCGTCEHRCPVPGEAAIRVYRS